VQQPHPPIIIGGKGRNRTPLLAARYAAEFNANFEPAEPTAGRFARVREVCAANGRDPDSLIYSIANTTCVGRDDAELKHRAAAVGRAPEDLVANGFAGTVTQVVDTLGRYADAGATRFYLQVLDLQDLEHLELIAGEVVPQLG
jgi:alkanesulfonate monooxygenase SsuD/methylene tetrahydromethanopterin reductase-like flavin-dependent oxidoreductase (luciferase family)